MKKLINTRNTAIALIALVTLAFTTPAIANDTKKPQPAELRYLGTLNNYPVFELSFATELAGDFVVVIRDDQQNVVYKDIVKSGTVSKRYLLNTDELGNAPLQFEISSKKADNAVVYEINRNTVYINDLVVNKIK